MNNSYRTCGRMARFFTGKGWVKAMAAGGLLAVLSLPAGGTPAIVTPPASATNCPGAAAEFNVSATGTEPLSYQWYQNGTLAVGFDSPTLSLAGLAPANAGEYTVVVTDAEGSVTSAPALLALYSAPVITAQPASANKVQGDACVFTVAASGGLLTYQWSLNGTAIPDATNASLFINGAQYANVGSYQVTVANCAGSVSSAAATLSVRPVTAVSFDFDTPGQFTNNFNVRMYSNLSPTATNAQVWGETNLSGVGNSGCIDNVRANTGDDHTMVYYPSPFNFSRQGQVLNASMMFQYRTPTNNSTMLQVGFIYQTNTVNPNAAITTLSATNTAFGGGEGVTFMSFRVRATTSGSANSVIGFQHKPSARTGYFETNTTPQWVMLAPGEWYKVMVTFTNWKDTPVTVGSVTLSSNAIGACGVVQHMGATGTTPGTNVWVTNTALASLELATNSMLSVVARALENNGVERLDNFAAWMTEGPVRITYPLLDQTVIQNESATFVANVDGTPPYSYQWMSNGVDIAGATQNRFTIPQATMAANGASINYRVSNGSGSDTSGEAKLTVLADAIPPALISCGSLDGTKVGVKFSERVSASTAGDKSNYSVSSSTVEGVTVRPDGMGVELTLGMPLSGEFSLTVSGVEDLAGNAIVPGSTALSTVMGWTAYDLGGTDNVLPLTPGATYVPKAGDLDMTAGGADFWGAADDGHIAINPAPKTGDFDVKVRLQKMTRPCLWNNVSGWDDMAKAVLTARTGTGANAEIVQAGGQPTDLGQPMGRNYWEYAFRSPSTTNTSAGVYVNEPSAAANNSVDNFKNSLAYPNAWIRLRRVANSFTYYISSNNVDWVQRAQLVDPNFVWPEQMYIALGLTAHHDAPNYPVTCEWRDFGDVTFPSAVISDNLVVTPASGSAAAYSTLTFSAAASAQNVPASELGYQWQRSDGAGGWTNIPSANSTNQYSLMILPSELATLSFRCIVKVSGAQSVTSQVATVTEIIDTTGPTIATAAYAPGSTNAFLVVFSEPVNLARATDISYYRFTNTSAAGQNIPLTGSALFADTPSNTVVTLFAGIALTNSTLYKIFALNMQDRSPAQNETASSYKNLTVANSQRWRTNSILMERFLDLGTDNAGTLGSFTKHWRFLANNYTDLFYTNAMVFNDRWTNYQDDYGIRASTYFIPPETGVYQFYIRSDEAAQLSINTNAVNSTEPSGKTIIAYAETSSPWYTNNTTALGTNIYLAAGQRYYMEMLFKEGSGLDGFSMTYKLQSDPSLPATNEVASGAVFELPKGPVTLAGITSSKAIIQEGDYADFTAHITSGAGPYWVYWFTNGVLYENSNRAAYTTTLGPLHTGMTVGVVVSNLFSSASAVYADPVPPTVSGPSDQVVLCLGTATLNVSATGDEPLTYQWRLGGADLDGETNSSLVITNVTRTNAGPYSVVVSNAAGVSVSTNAMLILTDTTPPTLVCPADMEVECTAAANYEPSAVDACGGAVVVNCAPPSGSTFGLGATVVICEAVDEANNTNTCSFTVTGVDTIPPVMALNGLAEVTVECHTSFTDPGATATDTCAGTLAVTTSGSLNVNAVGNYILTYSAVDVVGNSNGVTRIVHVVDTTLPVVALNGLAEMTLECHTSFTDPGAAAADTCAGTLAVITYGSVNENTPGNYTLIYSAVDPLGNSNGVARIVHVVDTTLPVVALNGESDITLECHTTFTDPGATATDTCAGMLEVATNGTVDVNTVGDYILTYSAVDPSGNSNGVTRTVHVVDTALPVVALNGESDITLECHTSFTDPGASATDTCAGTFAVATNGTVDVNTVGDYILTYSAVDPSGNSNGVTRTVHVADTTLPVVALSGLVDVTVECHTSFTDPGASAMDTCAGMSEVATNGTVDVNTLGDYILTYSAVDASGNSNGVTRTVHVVDTALPVVALNGESDITLECHTSFTDPGATATDACAGTLEVSVTGTVDVNTIGNYTLTYSAADASGNSNAVTRTVHVVDMTRPVVTLNGLADMTVECHTSFTDPGASAMDTCAGMVEVGTNGTVDVNTPDNYILTYSAVDPSGNSNGIMRTVHVVDTTLPVVALSGLVDVTVECHTSFSDPGASAMDTCAGTLEVATNGTVDVNTLGDYILTYSAVDPSGNSNGVTRTVHVVDTTLPLVVLSGLADMTVECHGNFMDEGAVATDACAGNLAVSVTGAVDVNTVGTYILTYSATDPSGNPGSVVRTVNVVDTTLPIVALNGTPEITVECHASFTDPGATATDTCPGTLAVVTNGSVDVNTVGNYILTYSAVDPSGNSNGVTRTVHVVDATLPVVALNGLADMTVECHTSFTDPGAGATDSCAGTLAVSVTGTVDVNTIGNYTLTYSAADASGNSNGVTRTVHVVDMTLPVVALNGLADITVECDATFTDPGASAMDTCAGMLEVATNGTVDVNTLGDYILTYSAVDASGNSNRVTRTVHVVDTTLPIIALNGLADITLDCHTTFTDPGATAMDTCAGMVEVATNGTVDVNTVGDYILTYSAVDPSGNSNGIMRTVHVVDTTLPVVALSGLADVTVECHTSFSDPGASAMDTCAGMLEVATNGTVDVNTLGDYILTYSAVDPSGNSNGVTLTVHVVDTTLPLVVLNGLADMTVECHSSFTDPGASAMDTCAGTLEVSTNGSLDANAVGDYILTYSAVDPSGNSNGVTRTVHVVDTTLPVVALQGPAEMTVECHTIFTEPGAAATDTCAGDLAVSISGSADTNTLGTYTLTYTATDPSGNHASASRVVHVVDTTSPVVTVNGSADVTVECHGSFTDAGAVANDGCAGSVSVSVTGSVDVNTVGDYALTYHATDPSGNTGTAVRTVHVVDRTEPVVALNGPAELIVECHESFTDAGATATDTCAGSLSVSISGTVDVNAVGDYALTYSATDPSGNSRSVTRIVHMVDTGGPVLVMNGPNVITNSLLEAFVDPGAAANDTCAGTVAVSVSGAVDIYTVGVYTLTYIARDPSGNASPSATRTVYVVDSAPPAVCQNPVILWAFGGTNDNFTGPEPASPSPGQLLYLDGNDLRGFDEATEDRWFAHSLTALPGDIAEMKLRMKLRAVGPGTYPQNDTIKLAFTEPGGGFRDTNWTSRIGTNPADGAPGLVDYDWSYPNEREFVLNLSRLPNTNGTTTDLIAAINRRGFLDIYIQDDTDVDYIIVQMKTCQCQPDVEVNAPVGACQAVVSYATPGFVDDSAIAPVIACNPPSGASFPVGRTVVDCVAVDQGGNRGHCSFAVTVQSPAGEGRLSIEPAGTDLVVRWTATCSSYALEESGSIGPSASWAPAQGSLTITGTLYEFTASKQISPRFFRLRKE